MQRYINIITFQNLILFFNILFNDSITKINTIFAVSLFYYCQSNNNKNQ